MYKSFITVGFALASCVLGLILILSGAHLTAHARLLSLTPDPRSPIPDPQWGPDIRINPDLGSEPSAQRNYSIAINPTNPNNIIASYDSQGVHNSRSAYAWSTDAGRTWASGFFDGPWGSDALTPLGNAHVAFDHNG